MIMVNCTSNLLVISMRAYKLLHKTFYLSALHFVGLALHLKITLMFNKILLQVTFLWWFHH